MKTRSITATVCSILAVLGATSLAACGPCGGFTPNASARWGFESDCADGLCGFQVTQGAAERVTALTAGEHALRIHAGAAVDHALAVPMDFAPTAAMQITLRCDPGATISAALTIDETQQSSTVPNAMATTESNWIATLSPTTQWNGIIAPFTAPGTTTSPSDAGVVHRSAVKVHFAVAGTGSCEVDNIGIGVGSFAFCE